MADLCGACKTDLTQNETSQIIQRESTVDTRERLDLFLFNEIRVRLVKALIMNSIISNEMNLIILP